MLSKVSLHDASDIAIDVKVSEDGKSGWFSITLAIRAEEHELTIFCRKGDIRDIATRLRDAIAVSLKVPEARETV